MELPSKPFRKRRKLLSLFVIALGLLSFFQPLLYFDREVMGKVLWSPLDIARAVYTDKLPLPGGSIDWGPGGLLDIGVVYLLIMVSLAVLFIPGPPTALRVITTVGFFFSFEAKWWWSMLMRMFAYSPYLSHGRVNPLQMRRGLGGWVLPFVLPALLGICFWETLDDEESS